MGWNLVKILRNPTKMLKILRGLTSTGAFENCHQYFFIPLVLLDALQLAARATGLLSQGVTAVVHGYSVLALGHNLGEETGFTMATLLEGSENARNHTRLHSWTIYCFINLIQWQPSTESWNQQSWLSSNISMKPCKVYNKLGLQHLLSFDIIYWNYCRKNYFTLGILYRGGVWTKSGVIKAGSQSAQKGPIPLI